MPLIRVRQGGALQSLLASHCRRHPLAECHWRQRGRRCRQQVCEGRFDTLRLLPQVVGSSGSCRLCQPPSPPLSWSCHH